MMAPLHLGGERLLLDPRGALLWPARRTLIVADLHLEKGTAFARQGRFLPPYDSRVTLERLGAVVRTHRPERVISLGDAFHDAEALARLGQEEAAALRALCLGREMVWIAGNHDPESGAGLPGTTAQDLSCGPFLFRHVPAPPTMPPWRRSTGPIEIAGHLHPKAAIRTRGGELCRSCFVVDPARVLLPAFGAYTGGLNVRDPAIASLFPRGARTFLLGRERLYSFPLAQAQLRDVA